MPAAAARVLGRYALQMVAAKATDRSVLVRKAAIAVLNDLLALEPATPAVQQLWLAAVLPSIADNEASVVAKAAEYVQEHVFDALAGWHAAVTSRSWGEQRDSAASCASVWSLLHGISGNADLVSCLGKALSCLAKGSGAMGAAMTASAMPVSQLVAIVHHAVAIANAGERGQVDLPGALAGAVPVDVYRRGAWLLLEQAAAVHTPKGLAAASSDGHKDTAAAASALAGAVPFVLSSWTAMGRAIAAVADAATDAGASAAGMQLDATAAAAEDALAEDATRALKILTLLAPRVPPAQAKLVSTGLLAGLRRFAWPSGLAAAAVKALATLTLAHAAGNAAAATAATEEWGASLLAAAEAGLVAYVAGSAAASAAVAVSACLFTIGEVAMLGLDNDAGQGVQEARSHAAAGASGSSGKLVPVTISSRVVTLVQALLSPTLDPALMGAPAAGSGGAGVGSRVIAVPDELRAHAYICLGKLCLRDAALAKKVRSKQCLVV
jgi:hypothetical protein